MSSDPGRTDEFSFGSELGAYLAALPPGAELDLETLSARFPDYASRLDELVPVLTAIRGAFSEPGGLEAAASVCERIETAYGAACDPQLTLPESDAGFGSEPNASGAAGEAEGPAKTGDTPRELLERLRDQVPEQARYEALGEVARGGMGVVFRVWDADLRRRLAMKVLVPRNAGALEDPTERARTLGRFLEEAQITGQLDHPGVVPVHELGIDPEGRIYFTMRLVRGHELRTVYAFVKDPQSDWNQTRALGVLLKVCETLAYAHAKGVIHRDLKPSNIMVGRFGEVYVMDWGLARVLGREDSHCLQLAETPDSLSVVATGRGDERVANPDTPLITLDGSVIGTPSYMPPEQALGQTELMDHRADVYAIGAMLYELLVGRGPYQPSGGALSARTILLAVVNGAPQAIDTLVPDSPPELVAICEKAMARDPKSRYVDTLAMAEDLRAYLENRVVGAHRTGAWVEFRKWVQRNRSTALAWAAALLVLIGGLIVSTRFFAEAARSARDVFSLAASERVRDLRAEAETLWPVHPERVAALTSWIERAEVLTADRAGLEGHLAAVRERGTRSARPVAASLVPAEARAREGSVEVAGDLDVRSEFAVWSFAAPEDEWWHGQLCELLADFDAFTDPETGWIDGFVPGSGWGVRQRRELARNLAGRTLDAAEVQARWGEACAIAAEGDGAYGPNGVQLTPQLGLVPLGADPRSGLLEFAAVLSGAAPERNPETGELELDGEHGVVLVLLPAGDFVQGAQLDDPTVAGYDARAESDEGPPQRVEVEPFFLAKHELTQAQWERLDGNNPSEYPLSGSTQPVERVEWLHAQRVLERIGLQLPTETQWEYGARAGSTEPWWTGRDPARLPSAANLASAEAGALDANWARQRGGYVDGYAVHAPVDTLDPNRFGLHHVLGNVSEWCLDVYAREFGGEPFDPGERSYRGGSFVNREVSARVSNRSHAAYVDFTAANLGVRPARALERP